MAATPSVWHRVRDEAVAALGVPDVRWVSPRDAIYRDQTGRSAHASGVLELKATPSPRGRLIKLRPTQVGWLVRWAQAGGLGAIACQTLVGWWVWTPPLSSQTVTMHWAEALTGPDPWYHACAGALRAADVLPQVLRLTAASHIP
jgi:hypothetical protein